ncbi:MAG TPA: carbohydrate kinase family protein [Gammaproteobacteria bacterium]|nr:carbohydrate kinase family protein [Gammaproteobacteria bacterium]HIL18339.1 carbohydrate kinase family protein [Gammaproteobacteria bacterium]
MPILICGSFAYDTIMVFPDQFKNYILPDQIHILNVCFVTPELRREYGGCAGNIAYNLKLLGGNPLPMGTVGKDFQEYRQRLRTLNIPDHLVRELPELYTAQCTITTDQDNNQITSFHPGAMAEAHQNRVGDAHDIALGIVAPDGRDAMLQHARDFAAKGIPFLFDPGQNLPLFSRDELITCLDQSTWCVLNDYESQLLMNTTGGRIEDLAARVDALIITRGGEGSEIHVNGETITIPAVSVTSAIDPTGCGDAYRAGLLYALDKGWSWDIAGRVGALLGAIKVEHRGTQNHTFTREEFSDRLVETCGIDFINLRH